MRLSREEFWVLDPTVHWNDDLPLHCLFRPNRTFFLNKRRDIGLSQEQLIDLIVFMQTHGIMSVFQQKDKLHYCCQESFRVPGKRTLSDFTTFWENPVYYRKTAILDNLEIIKEHGRRENWDRIPCPPEMLCYCMTPLGGERWEETAHVDWNKYLDCWGILPNDADLAENQSLSFYRAAARREQTLDAYFDWKTRWDAHPDAFETTSFRRYHTERISPWRATYWRTFPEGYECDYLEYTVHLTEGKNEEEDERFHIFYEQSWQEHDALFDWNNSNARDFPFEGD